MDELEVIFLVKSSQVEVLLEIDKKARGLFGALEEALNLDERYVRLNLKDSDLQGGPQGIASLLQQVINNKL